jgi:hypothetical protein
MNPMHMHESEHLSDAIWGLYDLKQSRGYNYFKQEALDRTMWRVRFGKGFGPDVRQTAKLMNKRKSIPIQTSKVP